MLGMTFVCLKVILHGFETIFFPNFANSQIFHLTDIRLDEPSFVSDMLCAKQNELIKIKKVIGGHGIVISS